MKTLRSYLMRGTARSFLYARRWRAYKNPLLAIPRIRRSYPKNKRRGFTLLEIMVVLVIIGILAALVGPKISSYIRDAKITSTKAELGTIVTALNSYYNTRGQYPTSLYPIAKEYLDKAKLNDNKQMLDPFGVPYAYKTDDSGGLKNQTFRISSAGADNIHSSKDDITQSGGSKNVQDSGGDEFDDSLESDSIDEDFQ